MSSSPPSSPSSSSFEPGGIELSEKRLRELAGLLHGDDPLGRRSSLRVPVEGFVTIKPLGHGGAESALHVGVYDLSRNGIAIVSKGTISVATMAASTISRPRHLRNTKAKPASEQTKSESTTVTPVTSTELKMKVATGARRNAPE